MKWSEAAWQEASPVYEKIIAMPFIIELVNGTLDTQKFKFYIAQDSHYLEHFGRTLSLIAARAHRVEHVLDFIRFAEGAIVVENALHAGYFVAFGINENIPLSPSCHHYTSYLLKEASLSAVEVAMAAVLPCFWIYKQVGDFIYEYQNRSGNPYQNWIDTYAGEEFGLLVEKAIGICDEVAVTCTPMQQRLMTEAFMTSCRLEYMFWDSAWRLEKWPVEFKLI
jgi:thiaminase/transcriptional activator TenA